jgi:HAMP domain-containing protein
VIAPLFLVLSAAWGCLVYESATKNIINGFNRKLLVLSGSLASVIDADAHAAFQIPRRVTALSEGPSGALLGYDATGRSLLLIETKAGGARILRPWPAAGGPPSSLVFESPDNRVLALADEGKTLLKLGLDATPADTTLPLSEKLDGLFLDGSSLHGWNGTRELSVDPATGRCEPVGEKLPESVRCFLRYGANNQAIALSRDGKELLHIDKDGKLIDRIALHRDAKESDKPLPELQSLVYLDGRFFGSGASLVELDGELGIVDTKQFSTGYLSEQDPFFVRYRQPMIEARKSLHLTYYYTYVYQGEDRIYYVLDATEGPNHTLPGAQDQLPNEKSIEGARIVQYLKRPWVSDIQQWEQWGLVKSSSYPILDSKGETVAVAGADLDVSIIREKTRMTVFVVVLIGIGFLVAASLVSYQIARSLLRPLRSLKESALRIAAGNYRAAVDSGNSPETAKLGKTLGQLGERLVEQEQRSRNFQDSLHQRRRHITLARALEEFAAKFTISDVSSAQNQTATGNCWRGLDGVFWLTAPSKDEVGAACLRSRLSFLGRQLLVAGGDASQTPGELLASSPDLLACARWHTASRRLYYATRKASWIWIGSNLKQLDGSGYIEPSSEDHIEWSDEGPEGFEVTEAEKGAAS